MDDTTTTLLVVIALLMVAGVAVWLYMRKRRSAALRERFGPEYERAVHVAGEPMKAEAILEERARRVEQLNLRPLSPTDRDRLAEAWRRIQARFVDEPQLAVVDGDRLIVEAMRARGYPVENFDQRADDLSVHHSDVVHHYRAGREIALRHQRGEAGTEDLRQAMVHFRALFAELIEANPNKTRRAS